MALDDKKLDQGNNGTPDGADPKDQSDSSIPSEGDTKPDKGSESWELNVNGTVHKFNEKELIEYVSKGLDYTQKTQVLADEKKRFVPYEPFMEKMETNENFRNKVIEFVDDLESTDNNSSDDFGTDPKLLREMGDLRQQVTALTQGREFEALEAKYGSKIKIDPVEITAYMGANRIANPEAAFLMMKHDALQEAARIEGMAIGKKGGGDASKILVSPGKPGLKAEPKVDVKNMSSVDKKKIATKLLESTE